MKKKQVKNQEITLKKGDKIKLYSEIIRTVDKVFEDGSFQVGYTIYSARHIEKVKKIDKIKE